MSELITPEFVDLDLDAEDKHAATRRLAELLVAGGRVTDLDGFLADVRAREEQMSTGLPGGIGIPHAKSMHVVTPTLAFGRSPAGVDFGADDGPARLVFLIAAPDGGDSEHLQILAALARRLVSQEFTEALLSAPDAATVAGIVMREVVPS
ncbi:PTS sugar transporter subunit IIA [Actinobacteria bacterium YIM 96077]|uniref:PTS sugar transporter subunit IIA n=1 Tax=Phytoactinopolyspora halophila TaxID=1981511 RepID=A0A329QA52_9ACTN|nr:PTS sugar transporter subunit IIA [Phytoactinopolyspora halophila]AYY12443.1 PTS sugar transporter subunit IIA [Actinobacteria bacterium YIM 96077]RAW09275.1 PTS sugar transporter subunit IIA [Phytoactinopolyspora halophila]